MSKRGRRPVAPGLTQGRKAVERSQSFLIVGACVVVAVVIVAAAAWQPVSDKVRLSVYRGESLQDVGASPAAAHCHDVVSVAVSGSTAQTADSQGIFAAAPPAYGPYSAAATASDGTSTAPTGATFYDSTDRPSVTELVGDEHAGYTILWYDATVSGGELAQIKAIVQKLDDTADDRDDLIAAPWTASDAASVDRPLTQFPAGTHLAFTHWSAGGVGKTTTGTQAGVFEYCAGVSGAALKSFMEDYPYTDSPSPGTLPSAQTGS